MAFYVDTSALVKLVAVESESEALTSWATTASSALVCSDLARTELARAVRRVSPELMVRARAVLDAMVIIQVPTSVFDAAGRLDPVALRSLDVLHVASALSLGDDLDGLVTYDARLAAAATGQGVAVLSPGAR